VVTGSEFPLNEAALHPRKQRLGGQHVVEAPADVALPHVSPRRPPGEQLVILRFERAAHVDQAVGDDPFELFALDRELTDRVRLARAEFHQ